MSRRSKPTEIEIPGMESYLRKIVLVALTVLGIGFILVNVPITILLGYSVSKLEISSQQNVAEISGITLFILASIALMVVGLLLVYGAVQYYERGITKGVVFLGALLASFYLLCLSVGSVLLIQKADLDMLLMLAGSVLIMISVALYMMPSFHLKMSGATLGVLGGIFLARVIYATPVLDLVFKWEIPLTGPFMSLVVLESVVLILGPIAALAHSFSSNHSEGETLTHVFLLLIALIYGIGLFIGSLLLSLSFWNWIWKSPWEGPFLNMPNWVLSIVVFWSASLFLIVVGGILLVVSSFIGFIFVAQELS